MLIDETQAGLGEGREEREWEGEHQQPSGFHDGQSGVSPAQSLPAPPVKPLLSAPADSQATRSCHGKELGFLQMSPLWDDHEPQALSYGKNVLCLLLSS